MDGHHEGCRVHFRDWYEQEKIYECSCECHIDKPKPPLPKPLEVAPDGKKKSGKSRNKNLTNENIPPTTIKRSRRKKGSG